jgi:hypothetical protein
MEETMRDAGRRPVGRLCYWVLAIVATSGIGSTAWGAAPVPQSGPATTTVADTVYSASGSPAQGSLLISWPPFATASGTAVAAGATNTTLGTNGALSVALVPNAGATPAGMYYTVVYQIGPGQVKTEYWIVPTASPANLAAVRITPGSGVAGQAVSIQYVNSELATKANDNAVVHLAATESISGAKTFTASPSVPTPTTTGQVANKAYVDTSVSNVGAGVYLPTVGGTMTGPITLPGNPASANQAATKQYVDVGLASKADLITGLVPAGELGTGLATSGTCLFGNGTWAACGGGGGAGDISTSPTASQTIAQPGGTQFATNNLANIRYVTSSWNWAQTPADSLATAGNVTIHLSPCPMGIDTAASANHYTYKVYISGTGTAEAVPVTGGSCAAGASSGTITVTTAFPHSAGYAVGSASTGIQEAWNDAWVNDIALGSAAQTSPYVKLASGQQYNVYASIYLRGRGGVLDGAGALLACSTRDRCIYVGTTQGHPYVHHHKIYNLSGTSTVNVDGVQVSSVSATSGTYTVTTASAHPFLVGDMVDCEYHSQNAEQHWSSTVLSVPTSTSFTTSFGTGSFGASSSTFGFCNLLNTFIENNSDHVVVQDINIFQSNPAGFGYFSYGIVNDNDQEFIVERVTNRSTLVLNATANWPIGAFVYQRNDQGNNGITYIHGSEITGVNCATGGGNGFVMTDTVCQGFPVYGIRYFGGLQPATFQNIYQESTGGSMNPLYIVPGVFPNGIASQDGFVVQGGTGTKVLGTFPTSGYTPFFASGGGGGAERSYFVVPRSSTQGYGPVLFIGSAEPTNGSVSIPLMWPSVELQIASTAGVGTLTWDVLVVTGTASPAPFGTGSYAIATNISGSCATNGMCSFTDTQAAASSYTVQTQQFFPLFWFWPGNFAINNTVLLTDQTWANPSAVASQGTTGVSIIAEQCHAGGVGYRRSPIWIHCLASEYSGGSGSIATVLQEQDTSNGGPVVNSKGRLNFGKVINSPNDIITLQDSNFAKTMATIGERPTNDAGDMAIGLDQAGGMSERAGTSITSYINGVPSGTNYQERLTAAAKTFNVPVNVNGSLAVTAGTVTLPVTGTGSQCLHVSSTGVLTGTGADCGSGGGGSGTVNSGTASQVAMYSGSGAAVSGDSVFTDNGTTLNYAGLGGITAPSGSFSGNLTVNGQLLVAGPWTINTPIPGTAMPAAGAGTSALGISNDGNFYISANAGTPQKVATSGTSSYFSNLAQEDANDLGEYNGTNGQGLHVYGTYTNSSTYERTGLGWDATDGYFVVKNENAGTGTSQRGIGFWIGSSIRWGIDTTSTLKPFLNNSINIGSTTLAPQTIYAATSFDTLTTGRENFELCNDSSSGTGLNFLAVYNAATPACAVKAATSSTDGVIGIVSNGSGTSGNAVITYRGYVPCSFDGSTVAGDFVVASTSNAGDCHDAGATRPASVQVLGRVESTNTGVGTYSLRAALESPATSGAASVFGRTGTITAQSGDYSVGQITGAAALASPGLTGTPTAPTAAANTNTTQIATTAFVHGAVPPDNSSTVWMPVPHASSSGTVFSSSANKAALFGVMLGFQKTTTQVSYYVATADTSSTTYDLGIYSGTSAGTCTLVAHTGSIAGSTAMTSGAHTVSWTGGSVTLQPGRYYLGLTASATSGTAVLYGDSAGVTFAGGTGTSNVGNVAISSGGTLPATATCPTDSVQVAALIPAWMMN